MRDFRSLEQKIRQMQLDEAEARNTALRKKVENVGRPEDDNMETSSKLAKQSEIKTKIIDEASVGHHNFEVEYEKKRYSGDPHTVKKTETYKVPKEFHGQGVGSHGSIMKRIKDHPESASTHNKHTEAGFSVSAKPIKFKSTNEEVQIDEISTKLALNYAKKATASQDKLDTMSDEGHRKFLNRQKGQALALDKVHPERNRYMAKVGTKNEETVVEAIDQIQNMEKVDKKSKDSDKEKDPMKITGGKTEIDLKPVTNDAPEEQTMEDQKQKKASKEENKKIGAKGVKEETMSGKLTFGSSQSQINAVTEAMKMMKGVCPKCGKSPCQCDGDPKKMKEELVGGQKKLDANHNGKIDAEDFKLLKAKKMKEEVVDEAYGSNAGKTATGTKWSDNSVSVSVDHKGKKDVFTGKHAYVAKKLKDAHGMGMHEVKFKNAADMKEEIEQIDEISSATRASYRAKAGEQAKSLRKQMGVIAQVKTDDADTKSVVDTVKKDTKRKLNNRVSGILRSTQKEEVEFSEAEIARIEEIAKGL